MTAAPGTAAARAGARGGWREPASELPLRWGTYSDRYAIAVLLITGGMLEVLAANTYTVGFLLLGTVGHLAGWFILPGRGARRVAVAGPSLVVAWILLPGPQMVPALVVPLVCWLLVRERRALSYVVVVPALLVTFALANTLREAPQEPLAFFTAGATMVACAWGARLLAPLARKRRNRVALQSQ